MPKTKTRARRTLHDLERLPEETRAELIDGEILMAPAPSARHAEIVVRLIELLGPFVRGKRLGKLYASPVDVILPTADAVQPDLVFVATAHIGIVGKRIEGVPDLCIEVVSPTNAERDRLVKRDLYVRNGVPEYWIVDPDASTIEVLRLESGRYGTPALFEMGDTVASPTLPGLALPVREVMS